MSLEAAATITLLREKLVPWNRAAEAVADAGSARGLLERLRSGDDDRLFDLGDEAVPDLGDVVDEVAAWRSEGMHVIGCLDERYPENLTTVYDRPALLFVRGVMSHADSRSVAVVGARKAGPDALARAGEIVRELAEHDYVIVSGLAAGIDSAAHRAALDVGARTIAVIGTGLRRAFPAENADLQRHLGETTAVISQFWPDQPPAKHTFPMRNGVMSGIARATVVVEASNTSGARIQARLALQHSRPVFLLRSVLAQTWAQTYAKRPGVYVVDEPREIVARLARIYSSDLELVL